MTLPRGGQWWATRKARRQEDALRSASPGPGLTGVLIHRKHLVQCLTPRCHPGATQLLAAVIFPGKGIADGLGVAGRKPEVGGGAPGLVGCPDLAGDAIHPGQQVSGLAVESQGIGRGADVQAGVLTGGQQLLPALQHLLLPAGDGLCVLSRIHRPQLGCPLLELPHLKGTPAPAPAPPWGLGSALLPPPAGWVPGAHTLTIPQLSLPLFTPCCPVSFRMCLLLNFYWFC